MIRIFIVGYQRSGTTLLQSLLGAHDMLATFSESHLFKAAFRTWRVYRPMYKRRGPITPKVEKLLHENGLQALKKSDAARALRAIDKRKWVSGIELAEAILSLFDQIAIFQEKSGWLGKTLQHLYYCDLIAAAAPTAHFVHIAPQGEDAVASRWWSLLPIFCNPKNDDISLWNRGKWVLHLLLEYCLKGNDEIPFDYGRQRSIYFEDDFFTFGMVVKKN